MQSGTATMKEGKFTVTGKLDEPGFLQCRVDFKDPKGAGLTTRAGAGYDVLKIGPSLPPPDDFDAFWAGQRKAVDDCPPNVRITSVPSLKEGVEAFDLQADCAGGLKLSAYLARPIGAKPKSLPAILLLQGAGVASSRLSWTAEWA